MPLGDWERLSAALPGLRILDATALVQDAVVRNEALLACKRFSRSIWKRWSEYHRRSLAETKMICVKRLDQGIMAREFDRQVAELQIGTSILNRFTALGTPETIAVQRT